MTYRHPTVAEIDLEAFRRNLRLVKDQIGPGRGVLAVVKANAYGHGMIPIAHAALAEGAEGLGVAFVEEGIELRRAGVTSMILVMAGFMPEEAGALVEHGLTPVVSDAGQIEALQRISGKTDRPIRVHLKIDTGMGRLGLLENEVPAFMAKAREARGIEIHGLMSHFADDNLSDRRLAESQVEQFERIQGSIEAKGVKPSKFHMANSAGILGVPGSWFNLVRPGIMLYGYPPRGGDAPARSMTPVMTFKTRITHLRRVPAGTTVSYGRTHTTGRESLIAVLPVGYADGYSRAWSNRGRVLIGGRRVPVVGRVCMDMTMVDVTDIPKVREGGEAVLIGAQGAESIQADELALELGTIPYEILCAVGSRVPRVYREGGNRS
ncbi:MAG TPA: alanine racemase [Nitrospiria bacterium]